MANHLELLSPARDADIGIEAIKHGADAVYIGGPAFGARAGAANSVVDIARLVEFAHRFHAKIFVAFNTIFNDAEIDEARKLSWQLYDAGVDALIMQDMGLLELAIFATAMTVPKAAPYLYYFSFTAQYDIGPSGESCYVQPISIAHRKQEPAND